MRLAISAVLTLLTTACRTMGIATPSLGIHAVSTPQVIETGRILVYGPAHCVSCHGEAAAEDRAGTAIPLTGGRRFSAGPLGSITAPNLTSDRSSGLGALSDDTLVQILRYGISRHGTRPLIPFMAYSGMSDCDLQAVISFLRTLPPIASEASPNELGGLRSSAVKWLMKPGVPEGPPPECMAPARTAEYGRYLIFSVANCNGCHTGRSKLTGAFVGAPLAGGMAIKNGGRTFRPPNLTPVSHGVMREFSESTFIEYFRARATLPTRSPMPWKEFGRMSDDDLGAIFRYLRALAPH